MWHVRILDENKKLKWFKSPDKNWNIIANSAESAFPFFNFKNALNYAYRNNGFVEKVTDPECLKQYQV